MRGPDKIKSYFALEKPAYPHGGFRHNNNIGMTAGPWFRRPAGPVPFRHRQRAKVLPTCRLALLYLAVILLVQGMPGASSASTSSALTNDLRR